MLICLQFKLGKYNLLSPSNNAGNINDISLFPFINTEIWSKSMKVEWNSQLPGCKIWYLSYLQCPFKGFCHTWPNTDQDMETFSYVRQSTHTHTHTETHTHRAVLTQSWTPQRCQLCHWYLATKQKQINIGQTDWFIHDYHINMLLLWDKLQYRSLTVIHNSNQ